MDSDMKQVIIPKSDQLNSDDLISGPITVRIACVTIRGGQEQPISVSYEGDGGKPWKPCKSMCRVMVTAWGADSKLYVGRSLTLYRDPKVKWAGMDVGGIRISHMTDIPETLTMALTATKGSRKPFTVKPLGKEQPKPAEQKPGELATPGAATLPQDTSAAAATLHPDQAIYLTDLLVGVTNGKQRLLHAIGKKLGREVKSLEAVPDSEYSGALAWIERAKQP